MLIKSCRVPDGATLQRLALAETVDPTFVEIVERARLSWRVLGAGDEDKLAALLQLRARAPRSA